MDISRITDYLYVAARPRGRDVAALTERNVRLVIGLALRHLPSPLFFRSPMRALWLPSFDSPVLRIPVRVLHRGVKAALPVIQDGGAVVTFCYEGRHRSVAMAAAILIARGYAADAAMSLLEQSRKAADPYAPHIESQIRKYETFWLAQ